MLLHHLQPSFAGGEISPSLYARVDSAAYGSWLKTARNFYVHPQGGASNRSGTAFMGTAKFAGKACRVVPFVLGEEEAYVLELGEKYLRVYTSSGRLLDTDGNPYEIATPYGAHELSSLNYTQYDQTLFLTHPSYPPKRLVRLDSGVFEFSDVPIKYGPFKISNTQDDKRLRVVRHQETISTVGVAATVSFLPVADGRYFVLGYFEGVRFFVGRDYGFDASFFACEFNRVFGASGFQAVCLGGVITVTSPKDTGGEWNGKQIILEYRKAFTRPPVSTVVYGFSGGISAGTQIDHDSDKYLLQSDFDLFTSGHIGSIFGLTHRVESQCVTGTLGYNGVSEKITTGSDWRLRTSGNWTGRLALEKSEDMGSSWETVMYFSRNSGEAAPSSVGTLEDSGELMCLRVRAVEVTGEVGYELQSESFLQEGVVRITNVAGPRQAVVSVEHFCGAEDWTADWAEGSFSPKSGYPSSVFFYQDRLGLAGTRAEAQTVWFSRTGDHCHFGHARNALEDSDSFSVNLSGKKLNAIHSVAVAGKLLVFTAGSEWTLSCSGALTPYNVQIEQQSERGASRAVPIMVGNKALFVQARGGALRDFYYDYNTSSYTGSDLTLCAKHLFFNQEIREVCYQQEPDNLIWCVLSGGEIATLTYLAEENLCAWTHHDTQGFFRSVCVIPNRGYDEVWFAVERDGNYFIEKLLQRLSSKEPEDQIFLDASVSRKSDTSFSELTGLSHLEGKTVGVMADGNPITGMVVHNGKITLPRPMKCVHAGLCYEAELRTLPAALSDAGGALQDRKRRLVSVTLKMSDSRGGRAGTDENNLDELIQRSSEPFNMPIALQTGDYALTLSGTHGLMPSLIFRQTDPLPVTLLAVISRIV
ncbi:MAG: hypothetical protein ACI4Q7_02435 [Candidatus Avelusimicrobium sp.]